MEKEKLRTLALAYYSKKEIQEAICSFSQNRETIPLYKDIFGKRPDTLEFNSDVFQQVKKGATSFHCSEEIWQDPLSIVTGMEREKLDSMRKGWDLLIDIDSKYFEYSRIMALLIIEAFKFHNLKSFGVKYSGSKGFHIIVPWEAFPKKIQDKETQNMFPEWPRAISKYLADLINPELINRISRLTTSKSYVKDIEGAKKVIPDIILVSPRHLFRCPYSLHEKTGFASVVLNPEEVQDFQPKHADPFKVKVKSFCPQPKKDEAKQLLLHALDWEKEKQNKEEEMKKKSLSSNSNTPLKKTQQEYDSDLAKILKDKTKLNNPPCIETILKGLKEGKKRALFILINYFRSLGFTQQELTNKINEWNEKNNPKLKQGYLNTQIDWSFKKNKVLPPNCDKTNYNDIGVCNPNEFCKKIKNPVNYILLKQRMLYNNNFKKSSYKNSNKKSKNKDSKK